jgi:hypothetical protein
VMKGVDFKKAIEVLPPFCLALMQNVSPEDQQVLKRVVEDLATRNQDSNVNSLLLGLELINVVGVDVLATAVKSLGDQIRSTATVPKP